MDRNIYQLFRKSNFIYLKKVVKKVFFFTVLQTRRYNIADNFGFFL